MISLSFGDVSYRRVFSTEIGNFGFLAARSVLWSIFSQNSLKSVRLWEEKGSSTGCEFSNNFNSRRFIQKNKIHRMIKTIINFDEHFYDNAIILMNK